MTSNTKFLGIDYGDKRIGIAISDESHSIAFVRDYLNNDNNLFNNILNLIKTENISTIVIGYPINFKSEKTIQTIKVEEFKEKLQTFLNNNAFFPNIVFFDERLSSSLAQSHIISSGLKKKQRKIKGIIDSASAQIILQDFLDHKKNNNFKNFPQKI